MSGPGESPLDDEQHPVLLPWYAAGTLDAWSTRQVDEHLKVCPSCRLELEALTSAAATLRRHEGTNHIEIGELMDLESGSPGGGDRRAHAMREHLVACEVCREDFEALRSARAHVGQLPETGTTGSPAPRHSSGGSEAWRWAFYAAAAAAVVLLLPALRGLRPAASPPGGREIQSVRLMAPTRGEENGAVLSGPGPWAVDVVLPFGAPAGEYLTRIGPRGDSSGAAMSVRARATSDGRLGLFLPSLPEGDRFQLTAASLSDPGKSYDYWFTRVAGGPGDGRDSPR